MKGMAVGVEGGLCIGEGVEEAKAEPQTFILRSECFSTIWNTWDRAFLYEEQFSQVATTTH